MRRVLSIVLLVLAALVAVPSSLADQDSATSYYLSLGDSLAAGTTALLLGRVPAVRL